MEVTNTTVLADAWAFVSTVGLEPYIFAGLIVGVAYAVIRMVKKSAR